MKKTKILEEKIFLGLGIITIICGVLLAYEGQLLAGISGSIVGVWLSMDNLKKLKARNQ